ncbi:GNAT family N-acetyltransferase [Pedobacter sp. AW1-32]|uniref:GNAT family N-acetyltransferase n=1 Tax=Pedobacter sp. AW1-32 TaxID=3383026 RepID=UPI003FEDC67E
MNILIETPRLLIRQLELADAPGMFEMDSNPSVQKYLGMQPVRSIEESIKSIQFIRQQYLDYGVGRWAVIEKETDNFIGWSGFKWITDLTNGHRNYPDLGYRFLERAWGKGYASEAAIAAVDYGFKTLAYPEIFGIADVENLSSVRILEKVGLRKLSIFDYNGRPHHWLKVENKLANSDYKF